MDGRFFALFEAMAKKAVKKTQKKAKKTNSRKKAGSTSLSERGLWSGSISFGLVNIPVRVVSAKEQKEVHFTMLDPSNLSKVGYKYYNKETGEDISRSETVKGYEYEKGNFVIISDEDFKKAYPKATQTIDIENFVALEEIDPVFFEKAYYLVPTKGGQKGYKLLSQALQKQKKVAIAKFVMHMKQHLVALIPRGDYLLLETLHFADDVKEVRELEDKKAELPAAKNLAREVQMAEELIENMTEKWDPDSYEDTFRDDIMKLVQAKVKAGKGAEVRDIEPLEKDETPSNVTDLMPLLRKSLAAKNRKAGTGRSHRTAQ